MQRLQSEQLQVFVAKPRKQLATNPPTRQLLKQRSSL